MFNEASAGHHTRRPAETPLPPSSRKGGGPGATAGKAEEEETSEVSAPWKTRACQPYSGPWKLPLPTPERALPLLLQQHLDGPGPLAHLVLLCLLKAQVCPQQPHKISGGGTVAAGRTHCANKGSNRHWLQTLCLKNRDRLVCRGPSQEPESDGPSTEVGRGLVPDNQAGRNLLSVPK